MGNILSWQEVVAQSNTVFNQFGHSKWIPYAKFNKFFPHKNGKYLYHSGLGKFLLCCAMGESLEANIESIKKYRDRVDIVTCDKGFGQLIEHGIKADYVMLCDCNIPYRHIEKYIDQTKGVTLLSTVYANPKWHQHWQGERCFFINEDSIHTEKYFTNIYGNDLRIIPAGSNVSNAMVVYFTGCNEFTNENWAGYEKYILVGYDYSWRPKGNYYAWLNPKPKRNYMNHRTMLDYNGDMVFTSENLLFSAKWLYSYITTFKMPIVNCSNRGLLNLPFNNNLEKELSSLTDKPENRKKYLMSFKEAEEAFRTYHNKKQIYEKTRGVLYYDRPECGVRSNELCCNL
jgi:hypothetical protein